MCPARKFELSDILSGLPLAMNQENPIARGLIGLWTPHVNPYRGTVLTDLTYGRNGAFRAYGQPDWAVDPGMGHCLSFDGVNDYVDCLTSGFAGAFDGEEGTALQWLKVANVGVWTDATERGGLTVATLGVYGLYLYRPAANNQLAVNYEGIDVPFAASSLDWMLLGGTWSKSADSLRAYYNGIQAGADIGLDFWPDAPDIALIGAEGTGPDAVWSGKIGPTMVWNRVLAPAEIWRMWDPATRWDLYRLDVPALGVAARRAVPAVV